VSRFTQRLRQPPRRREFNFADALAGGCERRLEMVGMMLHLPGLDLHLGHLDLREVKLALGRNGLGGQLLAVALRTVTDRAEVLELRVHQPDAMLELDAGRRMPALHACREELRQRQWRQFDLAFLEIEVFLRQRGQCFR
jgi:hypothetical protein